MIGKSKSFTSFSSKDLDVAKKFYTEKLGCEILVDIDGAVVFKTGGDTKFMVYFKPNHVPAEFTVLNFEVDNVENEVKELNSKGIQMEKYPEMGTDELGITENGGGGKMVWFKDLDGNIISVMTINK